MSLRTGGSPAPQRQFLDSNNSQTVTSVEAQPANPWVGDWTVTRDRGVVRQLVVLAATDTTEDGLGGTFTFEYSEDGISNNGISEERTILDFQTVRDFNLLNAGAYFRIKFEPDRALSGDSVFITTTLRTQDDGDFVRLAGQQIEEANAAMGQSFSYLKAFVAETGRSINVRANAGEALLTAAFDIEVALGNISGYGNDTQFGRVQGIDAADNAVDIWAFADDSAVTRRDTKNFPTTADTLYITSSSVADTDVDVTIEYISSTGAAAEVTVNTDGQTPVSTGVTGLDVNRLYVSGGTAAVGILYATQGNDFTAGIPNDTADVLAVAPAGYQQDQLSQFTVPLGKTMIIRGGSIHVSRASGGNGSADVTLRIKEFGGVSRVVREWFPTNGSGVELPTDTHLVVPARSQVVWRVDDVSDTDTFVSVSWTFDLIDD